MNHEQLKALINYDYQLSTFAIGFHTHALQINEEWAKLSGELLDYSQKFGDFVHKQRQEGFSVVQEQVISAVG
jgi:hypothetical protein